MSASVLTPKDAINYRTGFRANGYELPSNDVINARVSLMKRCDISPIDEGNEIIIASLKVHATRPGILSWAKVILVPVNAVCVSAVEIAEVEGTTLAGILEGEILVTSHRIVYVYNSKSIDSMKYDEALDIELSRLAKALYEDDILVLRFLAPDIDFRWHMMFPRPSPAQTMSQTSSYAAKRDFDDLQKRGLGSRTVLFDFFASVIQTNYDGHLSSASVNPQSDDNVTVQSATRLRQLMVLLDAGLITQEAYATKRRTIIDDL